MRAYFSMPSREFIAQLRDVAIATKASPLFIGQIDQLGEVEGLKAELEKVGEELTAMEESRDHWREEARVFEERNQKLEEWVLDLKAELASAESED